MHLVTRLPWPALVRSAAAIPLLLGVLVGCAEKTPAQPPTPPPPPGSVESHLTELPTADHFAALVGEGWAVKYLAAMPGKVPPAALQHPCTFQNTARYPLHINFLRTLPGLADLDFESYRSLAVKQSTRVLWSGELQLLPAAAHPRTGRPGVLAFFVYADPPDAMSADELAALHSRIVSCAPYARDHLVLVGADPDQSRDFSAKGAVLQARGIVVGDAAQLRPVVGAEGYSTGEGVGYLRIVPRGVRPEAYGPRDVLVAEGSHEDLGLVAGLVTALPQNLHSHVNVRLREKRIPSARIADVYDNPTLAMLDGRLIRLTVTATEARLEAATLEEAQHFWATHRPPPRQLGGDLQETEVRHFSHLGAHQAAAYGPKAANLGELYAFLPPANRPEGFAVPFRLHQQFLQDSGLATIIAAVLAEPRLATDAAFRRTVLAELRQATEDAPFPAALLEQLRLPIVGAFGSNWERTPIRFRSSSNVEDGELGSGAGLHDSSRGCFADDADGDELGPSACLSAEERSRLQAELDRRKAELAANPGRPWLREIIEDLTGDLGRERTVARAIKKVYASLWNERAFEEREYFGMDHRRAYMGLAVNAAFVNERLDAVAVTNLPSQSGLPLYRVVSQKDGQPVVRPPDPTLVAETLVFRRGPDARPTSVELVTASSLSPGTSLWPEPKLTELATLLFLVQDHFARAVYPQIPNLHLDMEIKVTADDRIVIKQARPYRGGEP